jgi:hypothetical protein
MRLFGLLSAAAIIGLLVAGPEVARAQQNSPAETVIGYWEMEDAYTVHIDGARDIRLESHDAGRFTVDVIVYSDGTGVLGDSGFSWRVEGDAVVWDLGERAIRTLPRPIDENTVLLVALVEGDVSGGAAISVLHRRRD